MAIGAAFSGPLEAVQLLDLCNIFNDSGRGGSFLRGRVMRWEGQEVGAAVGGGGQWELLGGGRQWELLGGGRQGEVLGRGRQ